MLVIYAVLWLLIPLDWYFFCGSISGVACAVELPELGDASGS
jgi:hypothetical protein